MTLKLGLYRCIWLLTKLGGKRIKRENSKEKHTHLIVWYLTTEKKVMKKVFFFQVIHDSDGFQ